MYGFNPYFALRSALDGSKFKKIIFFSVLLGKVEKITKYRFWLQKGFKIQNNFTFENFGRELYLNSTLIFRVNSFWKDLPLKVYFSLAFYAELLKNHIIQFWVTKSG